jgi:sigma-B regulation protein RsbU (phosphoserine phosphatase)
VAGEDFGEARLQDVTRSTAEMSAQAIVEQIIAAVKAFAKGAPQSDDITVMVIRYLGTGA